MILRHRSLPASKQLSGETESIMKTNHSRVCLDVAKYLIMQMRCSVCKLAMNFMQINRVKTAALVSPTSQTSIVRMPSAFGRHSTSNAVAICMLKKRSHERSANQECPSIVVTDRSDQGKDDTTVVVGGQSDDRKSESDHLVDREDASFSRENMIGRAEARFAKSNGPCKRELR